MLRTGNYSNTVKNITKRYEEFIYESTALFNGAQVWLIAYFCSCSASVRDIWMTLEVTLVLMPFHCVVSAHAPAANV